MKDTHTTAPVATQEPAPPTLAIDYDTLTTVARNNRFEGLLIHARAAAADPDDYFALLPHLTGQAALWALEAVSEDINRLMAMITVLLAEKFMLPCIPEDHPLRHIAVELVKSYENWAVGGGSATNYADVAWDFKYDYDAARKFGNLCNALPSQGVDEEVGLGPSPARRWAAFGTLLMQTDPAGRQIDALWDALVEAEPEIDDEHDADPDASWWIDVFVGTRAARMAELQAPYDEAVKAVIATALRNYLIK